jgi:23S rRNA (guanosine2251-2'-O)-methyltransferase
VKGKASSLKGRHRSEETPPAPDGLFGVNPVLEALRAASRSFESVYIAREKGGSDIREIISRCREEGVPLHFEDREVLNRLSGREKHQGVIGFVSAKPYSTVEAILKVAERRKEDPFILILAGVEDPRNLGAIIRTAEAAGVHGILLPQRRAAGLTGTVAKTSAGGLEYLPVARVGNLGQMVEELKEKGLWVMALDVAGEMRYDRTDYRRPMAVLIGGEGRGLGPLMLKRADVRVTIPMAGQVSSLNVSVAAGVLIFEVLRCRGRTAPQP